MVSGVLLCSMVTEAMKVVFTTRHNMRGGPQMRVSKLIYSDDYIIIPYAAVVIAFLIWLGLKMHGV